MRKTGIILPLALLLCLCGGVSAWPVGDTAEVPDYDYSQTQWIVLYGEEGHVWLAHPFDYPAPVMGALVYEMILLYVPQFQDIIIPPVDPTHVMDLIMEDRHGERRIGQRLYLGDAWLSDGKSIAFLTPEDYRRLAGLLRDRYTGTEHYDPEQLAHLRRPKKEELPDNWLPEAASVAEAVNRMGPSDYEYSGYDPGAQIRHRHGNHNDYALPEVDPARIEAEENAISDTARANDADPVAQQPPSSPMVKESSLESDSIDPEPPVVLKNGVPQNETPQGRIPHEKEMDASIEERPATGDDNRWRLVLTIVALVAFLSVRLASRKTLRKGAGGEA